MERKIGEVFQDGEVTLKVEPSAFDFKCSLCHYYDESSEFCDNIHCVKSERSDNTNIYFKKQ